MKISVCLSFEEEKKGEDEGEQEQEQEEYRSWPVYEINNQTR